MDATEWLWDAAKPLVFRVERQMRKRTRRPKGYGTALVPTGRRKRLWDIGKGLPDNYRRCALVLSAILRYRYGEVPMKSL